MKLKISQSIISAWLKGDTDNALRGVMGIPTETNEFMEFGIKQHKKWELETKETKCLPKVFGGSRLKDPQTELYKREQINEWLFLSGIVDLKDGNTLYDYKTGKTKATAYTNSIQHKIYKVLIPNADKFVYLCWNQYTDTVSSSLVLLNENTVQEGFNIVLTVGGEIRQWLENNNYSDFNNVDIPLKNSENKYYEKC